MWISELSERTCVPLDTIKHYLRIGVLPKGELVGPHRAEYDEEHVQRVLLVKAMTDVGRLSLDQVRSVFESVDESRTSLREAVGLAHLQLSARAIEGRTPSSEAVAVVDAMIERQSWQIEPDSTHRAALAVALDALASVRPPGFVTSHEFENLLDAYARHLGDVVGAELAQLDTSTRHRTVDSILSGSVLYEPLILAIRRLTHQHASRAWPGAEAWHEQTD